METKIIKNKITRDELCTLAHEQYGDLIKAVVDIEKSIMGVGGELHVDIQSLLISQEGSRGDMTWGINLYLDKNGDEFVEFDSMVNIKPLLGNKTRGVESEETKHKIRNIVASLVS